MPCSCASAKPSGCGSSSAHVGLRAPRRRVPNSARRTPTARAASERQRRLRPRSDEYRGRQGARRADAELLRRRHRRLLGRGRGERALDRVAHELVDRAGVAEAHLDLLRMHVDVDAARVDREPQRVRRLAVVMQHVAIRLAQRVRQHAVAHEAAVDEHVLAAALRRVGRAHRRSPSSATSPASASTRAACATKSSPGKLLDARPAGPAAGRRCATRPLCCSVKRDRRDARARCGETPRRSAPTRSLRCAGTCAAPAC